MLQEHHTNLPYLLGFRMVAVALQFDSLDNTFFSEYMVVPPYLLCSVNPILRSKPPQIIEADIRIRATTGNPLKKRSPGTHVPSP